MGSILCKVHDSKQLENDMESVASSHIITERNSIQTG